MKTKRKPGSAPQSDPEELIDCVEAGKILCLAPESVRKGKAGTRALTRIRVGEGRKKMVRVLKVEVLALRHEWVARAKQRQERTLRLIEGFGT